MSGCYIAYNVKMLNPISINLIDIMNRLSTKDLLTIGLHNVSKQAQNNYYVLRGKDVMRLFIPCSLVLAFVCYIFVGCLLEDRMN